MHNAQIPPTTRCAFLGPAWNAADLDGMATEDLEDARGISCEGILVAIIDAPLIDQQLAGGCVLLMAAAPALRQRLAVLAQQVQELTDGQPDLLSATRELAEEALTFLRTLPVPVTLDEAETLIDPDRV